MLKAYQDNLPALNKVLNEQILPGMRAQLEASKEISPETLQQQLDLQKQFGPQFTDVNTQLGRQGALGQVGTDAAALDEAKRTGLVDKALDLKKAADPEFFAGRSAIGKGITDLLASINPEGLTGGEEAQISRSLARSGTGAPSATRGALNAQVFGDKLNEKKKLFTSALGTASQALPGLKTDFDPFQVATGRSSGGTAPPAVNFAPGSVGGGGAGASGADTSGLFNTISNFKSAENAARTGQGTGAEKASKYAANAALTAYAIYAMV